MGRGPWARAHGPGPMGQGPWARAHGPWPKAQLLPIMLRIIFQKLCFFGNKYLLL